MNDVEAIKEQLDIVEVIGEYLDLKPAGQNFKTNCPFHQEKTPSLVVSPEKKIWKCFGCGEGGDVFSFVMKQESLDFKETLHLLASKAGITLSNIKHPQNRAKDRLIKINEIANSFFEKALEVANRAKIARNYLTDRGLLNQAIKEFAIGYSPDSWEALSSLLKKKGFSETEIKASGLVVIKDNGGYYDRFRGRLMFALRDNLGEVVGFAGRTLKTDEPGAKYINSPESLLYHKSNFLYNLDLAKSAIRKHGFVIVVEGYTDVISSHMAGVKNIVASSGTSLTIGQIDLIKRYTNNLVLAYDADLAGNKATFRGIELALARGLKIKVLSLPAGQDPDSLVRKDVKLWLEALKSKVGIMDYYFAQVLSSKNLVTIDEKTKAASELLPAINRLPDPIEKALYMRKLARELDIDESVLTEALVNIPQTNETTNQTTQKPSSSSQPIKEEYTLEDQIIALLITFPYLLDRNLDIVFSSEDHQALYLKCKKLYTKNKLINSSGLFSDVEESFGEKINFAILKAETDLINIDKQDILRQFASLLETMKKNRIKRELQALRMKLMEAEKDGDTASIDKISQKIQKLWIELK